MRAPCYCLITLATLLLPPAAEAQQLRQPPDATDQVRSPDGRGLITPPVTEFTVLRSGVEFDGGSLFEIVERGETLRAQLRVLSDGAGIFTGTWEISDPEISGFRPLGRVRMPSAGRQMRRHISPVLPTTRPGLYELRFRPTSGAPTGAIRYSVVPAPAAYGGGFALLEPQPHVPLRPDTRFQWAPVVAAAAYQLQILGGRERLVAVDLTGTSTQLRPPAFARLRDHKGPLDWRVVAFDADGLVLSISESRPTGGGSKP